MRAAEELLQELGIVDPRDIDLPAIAHCVGVEVQYRHLASCEAQIIGYRDRAVVYVSPNTMPHRKKFSTGHELGHWHHHRGQSFVCRSSDIGRPLDEKSKNAERLADAYSGDLILPPFMIRPMLEKPGDISFEDIIDLSNLFSASVTATAIRVMRMTRQPLVLIAHNLSGRMWQWSSITAGSLRVRDDIDHRSSAIVTLMSGGKASSPRKEPAHYWFDRRHIEQFDVRVQSLRIVESEVLTLLRIPDLKMIEIYGR
uniref:IrrE N-terminal-like domain-containing protein n=1 Tax=Rhodopseudomonas palustris (strain BisA53) TaxID=316055 RepID=Q07NP9_RHOP5